MWGEIDWTVVAVIVGAFLLAGTVKGTLGVGLPMVSVPIIASVTTPVTAVALLVVPGFTANIWQAVQGGHYGYCLKRFWPLLLALVVGTLIGARILVDVDPRVVARLLGGILIAFSLLRILPVRLAISDGTEPWLGPLAGFVAGILGGISTFHGPVLILYLVALRVPKDVFVSAIALFFVTGLAALYSTLAMHGVLAAAELAASAAAMIPVGLGMFMGRWLRHRISQPVFEKVLVGVLIVIGLNLIRRSFF